MVARHCVLVGLIQCICSIIVKGDWLHLVGGTDWFKLWLTWYQNTLLAYKAGKSCPFCCFKINYIYCILCYELLCTGATTRRLVPIWLKKCWLGRKEPYQTNILWRRYFGSTNVKLYCCMTLIKISSWLAETSFHCLWQILWGKFSPWQDDIRICQCCNIDLTLFKISTELKPHLS